MAEPRIERPRPSFIVLTNAKGKEVGRIVVTLDDGALPRDYTDEELFFMIVVARRGQWMSEQWASLAVLSSTDKEIVRWSWDDVLTEKYYDLTKHDQIRRRLRPA